jgi:hypothetical protein
VALRKGAKGWCANINGRGDPLQIDLGYLRRHYASLSDDALREIDETELVEEARRIYDEEFARRELTLEQDTASNEDDDGDATALEETGDKSADHLDEGPEPEWLHEAAVAASFVSRRGMDSTDSALEARDALEAAGIPCYLSSTKVDGPQTGQPREELRLMVPGGAALEAESVLDKKIFNREIEAQWKTYFQMLSDDELREVDIEVLLAGLKNRIARLTKAYGDELKQRQ